MNVYIYQTGKNHVTTAINGNTIGHFRKSAGNRNNVPMIDENIRIDQTALL